MPVLLKFFCLHGSPYLPYDQEDWDLQRGSEAEGQGLFWKVLCMACWHHQCCNQPPPASHCATHCELHCHRPPQTPRLCEHISGNVLIPDKAVVFIISMSVVPGVIYFNLSLRVKGNFFSFPRLEKKKLWFSSCPSEPIVASVSPLLPHTYYSTWTF